MALYYGKHRVKDYETWRPYFDADQDRIRKVGAKTISVMRSTEDPNDIHFVFDVPDFPAFVGELQTPELQAILQKAGVLEQPMMFKLEEMRP